LQSLDTWLRFAYVKDWIFEDTLIILVPNKVDLERPDDKTLNQALKHIKEFAKEHELPIEGDQIITIETSCVSMEGVHNLRDTIMQWVAFNGIQGVGIKEIEEATKEVMN
jgi:GTPase SAR1 family protein